MIDVTTLKHQRDFIFSDKTYNGLVAGYGSGKSIAATLKTIYKHTQLYYSKTNNRVGIDCAYYLPTYQLIKQIAFPNFRRYLDLFKISYELNLSDKEIKTDYGKIIFRSLDNSDLIIGYEVGYSVVDEADVLNKDKMRDAFIKILGRNRQVENAQLDFVSTPEGFGFMYDFFVSEPAQKNIDNRKLIKAKSTDNPFLPDTFIQELYNSYDEKRVDAYINGEFVNFRTGNVYNFDRTLHHTDKVADDKSVLHIGMDFNITNMSAVVHIVENNKFYAVDEFTEVYDTYSMVERIRERYPKNYIIIYPDASGQNRHSSGKTDVQILQQAGFKIKVGSKNPFVRDRVNEVNKQFRDGNYFVNLKKCSKLVEAFEQIGYKGGEPDKTSGYDHVTDSAGYFIFMQKRATIGYKG